MKFKVGDKVRVRKDLEVYRMYGKYEFEKEQEEFKGKLAIIENVNKASNYYDLNIDCEEFYWTDEMLEPIDENIAYTDEIAENTDESIEKSIDQFKKEYLEFGDIVTLRDGNITICTGNKLSNEYIEIELLKYDEDGKHSDNNAWDIIKVESYVEDVKSEIFTLETLYERKKILDEKEKEYLQEIINIFSEKVCSIERDDDSNIIFYFSSSLARQPMDLYKLKYKYKKMEENHKYTLEELGL